MIYDILWTKQATLNLTNCCMAQYKSVLFNFKNIYFCRLVYCCLSPDFYEFIYLQLLTGEKETDLDILLKEAHQLSKFYGHSFVKSMEDKVLSSTVPQNNIGAPKIQNSFSAIKFYIFVILLLELFFLLVKLTHLIVFV